MLAEADAREIISFGKQEIIKRRELYKKIVDIIWNIDNLKI